MINDMLLSSFPFLPLLELKKMAKSHKVTNHKVTNHKVTKSQSFSSIFTLYHNHGVVPTIHYIVTEDHHYDILKQTPFPYIDVVGIDEFIKVLQG